MPSISKLKISKTVMTMARHATVKTGRPCYIYEFSHPGKNGKRLSGHYLATKFLDGQKPVGVCVPPLSWKDANEIRKIDYDRS